MASFDTVINGIDLTVYYTCEFERDPYGTGDSPDVYNIDITEVEVADSTVNILSLLPDSVISDIEDEIIDLETN
jgi:cytidylate kinase